MTHNRKSQTANRQSESSPAASKGELVDRWQKKAADLEKIADRRESMDEDVSSLRNMAFTLTECALALTQAKF